MLLLLASKNKKHIHPSYYRTLLNAIVCLWSVCSSSVAETDRHIDHNTDADGALEGPSASSASSCSSSTTCSSSFSASLNTNNNNNSEEDSSNLVRSSSLREMTYVIDNDDDDDDSGYWFRSSSSKSSDDDSSSDASSYTFWAYTEPDVASFYYNDDDKTRTRKRTRVQPKYDGKIGKFINLSNQPLQLLFRKSLDSPYEVLRDFDPFMATGFTTKPGYIFSFRKKDNDGSHKIVENFFVRHHPNTSSVYIYDPYDDTTSISALFSQKNAKTTTDQKKKTKNNYNQLYQKLKKSDKQLYRRWKKSLQFAKQYEEFTGRLYLPSAGYPKPRSQPRHFMWEADRFGQEHWVTTKETHFTTMPTPEKRLLPTLFLEEEQRERLRDKDQQLFPEYRRNNNEKQQPLLNMTLRVLSCRPRIFEIEHFLSDVEIDHIVTDFAEGSGHLMERSSTSNKTTRSTRTSTNTWLKRETSPILDAIYRRAADLLRMDEALLRKRTADEEPPTAANKNHRDDVLQTTQKSLAESLQLVHYDVGQEYTPHHDFHYADVTNEIQPARFATVLMYLNDDMEGGETSFPRYSNAETFHDLRVKAQKGKAILFYSQLPDGNFDELSHHASLPVRKGEKWLINLWVWDPIRV